MKMKPQKRSTAQDEQWRFYLIDRTENILGQQHQYLHTALSKKVLWSMVQILQSDLNEL